MHTRTLLLFSIAISFSASETPASASETVTILSSKSGQKLSAEVKPAPNGMVTVRVTITDPLGNSRALPPSTATPDSNGRITGPELPLESRGFLLKVEIIDPSTGRSLGTNWGFVG